MKLRPIKTIQKELKEHEDLLEFAVEQDEKDFLKDAIKGLKDELKKAEETAKRPKKMKAPFKVGDTVKSEKHTGVVKKISRTKEGTGLYETETHVIDILKEDGKRAINQGASKFELVKYKAAKKAEKRFIEVDGKKIFEDDPLFCSKLIEQWEQRKKDHKKAAGKRKTRSIMVQVASSAASTVVKGIKNISHEELEKNAAKEIKKMKRLEAAAKEYVDAYKDIVGEKLTQKEVKEEFEGVSGLINKIETKYVKGTKKKMADGGETKKMWHHYDWENDENKALAKWLFTSVDGNNVLSKSNNAEELEKNVFAYAKKKGSVAGMDYVDVNEAEEDEGLSWVTFHDMWTNIEEIKNPKK